jgi:hypothetical protein
MVVKSGTHGTATVTISTTANGMLLPTPNGKPMAWNRIPVLLLVLAIMYLLYWATKRSESPYGRRITARLAFAAPVMILVLAMTTITGCSGLVSQTVKTPASDGTPAGTYNLVVKATAGNLTHTANITLVVN